jgi:hypothetical protein
VGMNERLSKAEIRKDAVQNTVEAAASTVGQVATILTSAVKDVASSVGGLATELFEIRESARRAAADAEPGDGDLELQVDPDGPGSTTAGTAPATHPDPDAPGA